MVALEGISGSAFLHSGGGLVLTTGHPLIFAPFFFFPQGTASARLVETVLTVPADARVDRAELLVTAAPGSVDGDDAKVLSVADVRPANPQVSDRNAVALDFGALVTVGGLLVPALSAPILATYAWTGSSWRPMTGGGAFPEVATERLLVEVARTTSAESLVATMADSTVVLPSLPAGLELLVDGSSVWFERQGSSTGVTAPEAAGGVGFGVDRTAAVQEALARARVVDGQRSVTVLLRATTPGRLTLTARTEVLRQHLVAFPPDGLTRTVDVAEEGQLTFDVTPPAGAADVREVALTLRGAFGPNRVTPPVGPAVEPDAVLVLAPARPVLVGLPAVLAGRLGTLSGVRLRVTTAPGGPGVEIAGRLLADAGGRPGAPVPAGDLTPLPLAAGTSGWVTLPLAEPVEVVTPPEGAAHQWWLELIVAYGEAELALTTAPAPQHREPTDLPDPGLPDPGPPLLAPGAPVLRRLPGGGTAAHTHVPVLGTLNAAVRLVGRPGSDRPLPAVELVVPRSAAAAAVTPTGDDLAVVLTLPAPFVAPADGPVTLAATVAAPGSLTLDQVRVAYTEATAENGEGAP